MSISGENEKALKNSAPLIINTYKETGIERYFLNKVKVNILVLKSVSYLIKKL